MSYTVPESPVKQESLYSKSKTDSSSDADVVATLPDGQGPLSQQAQTLNQRLLPPASAQTPQQVEMAGLFGLGR